MRRESSAMKSCVLALSDQRCAQRAHLLIAVPDDSVAVGKLACLDLVAFAQEGLVWGGGLGHLHLHQHASWCDFELDTHAGG